jgi:hypothetical protein
MRTRIPVATALCLIVLAVLRPRVGAQHAGAFMGSPDDPAIRYSTAPPRNIVADLNARLRDGAARFSFDPRSGFLQSALEGLGMPVDSQLLVFSRTSLQGRRIGEQNPRAIFFNDRAALGWVRGGDVIEVAAHDESAGIVFYTLEQRKELVTDPPQFKRASVCLGCHVASDTLGVPGLLMFSTTRPEASQFSGVPRHVDQGDPLTQRFGGWFVTGSTGSARHMGNEAAAVDGRASRELASVDGLFDTAGYVTLTSDVVAHLVLTHQAGMTNLLTRAGWEAREAADRPATAADVMSGVAREVVDHLLFVDEAKLVDRVRGVSGFAERFSARAPRDRRGRSLYELDLTRRLMKYPCSYLIYSPAFDALPPLVKEPIYRRMWDVLSGREDDPRYRAVLSRADRQAIVEILRETKNDLPPYFTGRLVP